MKRASSKEPANGADEAEDEARMDRMQHVHIKGKGVEDAQNSAMAAGQRMMVNEAKSERFQHEEDEKVIAQMLEDGELTVEEAQKRIARGRMHQAEREGPQIKGIVAAGADFQTTEQMLEDHLDTASKNACVRWFKKKTGIAAIERAVKMQEKKRKERGYKHKFPCVKRMVQSTYFELAIGAVMILNGATIGMQAGKTSEQAAEEERSGMSMMTMMEHMMTTVFCLEIVLRMMCDGALLWIWNLQNGADTSLIILTGVVPLWILGPAKVKIDQIRNFQVLRVVRLVRLVRMVRTVKEFRTFWKLIQGLMDSSKTLLWMYILLGAVLYTFAIFAVYWIGKDPNLIDDEIAQVHFGDVPKAMLTLFQVMTLDGWSFITRPLMKQSPGNAPRICFLFIIVIMLTTLVLMNLVTAIIVNNAFARAEQDEEINVMIKREEVAGEIEELKLIFHEIDTDGSGLLSKEEYDEALESSDRVQLKFDVLQIGENERQEIWELIDTGSGEVSVDRFADTLRAIQGEAKAKESFTIVREVAKLNTHLEKLAGQMDRHRDFADEVRDECAAVHRQLGGTLLEMIEFVTLAGQCIPANPAPRSKKSLEDLTGKITKKVDHMERLRLEQQAQRDVAKQKSLMRRRPGRPQSPGGPQTPTSPTSPGTSFVGEPLSPGDRPISPPMF